MTTPHQQYYWIGGDDWQINATLLDRLGVPFDLGGTTEIKFALINEAGVRVLDEADCDIVVIDAAAGQCAIHIPAVATTTIATGRYTDMIGVKSDGMMSTLAYGLYWVTADPWAAVG
jgi:hypothetical protein